MLVIGPVVEALWMHVLLTSLAAIRRYMRFFTLRHTTMHRSSSSPADLALEEFFLWLLAILGWKVTHVLRDVWYRGRVLFTFLLSSTACCLVHERIMSVGVGLQK